MLLKVYSVFDIKVGAYLPPIYFRSKGEAIRAFGSAAQSGDHDFNKYAEDYTLFELGEFDDGTAKFHCHLTAIPVGKAIEFIAKNDDSISLSVN